MTRRSRRPGTVPVAEQDRQGAVAGRQRDWRAIAGVGGRARGPEQLVVGAPGRHLARVVERDVVPEGEGRQAVGPFPRGRERRRPGTARRDAPRLVRGLEPAVAEAAQLGVADPQDREVDHPVGIDVDRVGTRHGIEVRPGPVDAGELERAADGARVAEQLGRVLAARQVDVRSPVAVAVEDRDAAAGQRGQAAVERVNEARRGRLLDVVRGPVR